LGNFVYYICILVFVWREEMKTKNDYTGLIFVVAIVIVILIWALLNYNNPIIISEL